LTPPFHDFQGQGYHWLEIVGVKPKNFAYCSTLRSGLFDKYPRGNPDLKLQIFTVFAKFDFWSV